AGGVDIIAEISAQKRPAKENLRAYEINIKDLQGGHSGVDIDKNIPNAIKILAQEIDADKCELSSICGGERMNSIPKSASAIVYAAKDFVLKNKDLNIQEMKGSGNIFVHSKNIIAMLQSFNQGMRSFNDELKIPNASINLSTIKTDDEKVRVEFFARAMDKKALENLRDETVVFLKSFGFEVKTEGFSAPWKPNITPFAKKLQKIVQKSFKNVEFKAMHAGLECGIFESINPSLQTASIGPNIHFPHSLNERCEIASVERVQKILEELIWDLE
ncbi:MAG: M20/M25/M40 family metallo-hydrolase, partial [Campylobacteraceae bacterium]|nr:M20/M25/M40 family metallo-hydrolase [Campylobacteraceae bacterium]